MVALLCFLLMLLASPFKSKNRLEAENAVLRHQLIVLQRKVRGRVQFTNSDRLFFIQLYRWFQSVLKAVTIIRPEQRAKARLLDIKHRFGDKRRTAAAQQGGRFNAEIVPLPSTKIVISEADKRRIIEEGVQPGASLSEVARRYGIAARVLFRWKQKLKPTAAPMFVTVQIADASAPSDAAPSQEERAP